MTSNTHAKQKRKEIEGQFAPAQAGGKNDGVASAKPTVITGSEDATVHKWPPGTKRPPKDWDINHDPAEHGE
ncbi:hypothetical protein J5N58_14785 [Rhizobium cremeum]|uniref:hypothetical protein n=1 Tax=Rhizobium cremeum TaxID=2813827 RepID=UPI000DDAE2FC|nr:hypothetical protein [Rhizobium cremeum]MCJ7995448.1 hypothetical protein [Rhizobium cremeum]MCJ8000946.1 hypothetical protein [Rhizobium cremeum]